MRHAISLTEKLKLSIVRGFSISSEHRGLSRRGPSSVTLLDLMPNSRKSAQKESRQFVIVQISACFCLSLFFRTESDLPQCFTKQKGDNVLLAVDGKILSKSSEGTFLTRFINYGICMNIRLLPIHCLPFGS